MLYATRDTIQTTVGRLLSNASSGLINWWAESAAADVDSEQEED